MSELEIDLLMFFKVKYNGVVALLYMNLLVLKVNS